MANISLCHIMGEIAASMLRKSPSIQDQPRITSLLTRWIRNLPKELSLHSEHESRLNYHFALYELYIEYLGTIILSTTLARQTERQSLCSALCIIAAMCAADLYEEVVCRDHVSFLGSIHGFWCMVAALPLLYCMPEKPATESRRKESLDIICSVLELMRCKFGVAETAAQKISDLTHERQNVLQQHMVESANRPSARLDSWTDEQEISQLESLFIDVRQWYPDVDEVLSDPGMKQSARADFETMENSNFWNLDGLYAVYDAPGAPAFTDPLFENIYSGDNFGTSLM